MTTCSPRRKAEGEQSPRVGAEMKPSKASAGGWPGVYTQR